MTPELLAKMAVWRAKANDGTLTIEEMREATTAMRADRKIAVSSSTSSKRAQAKAAVPTADDMLNELGIK